MTDQPLLQRLREVREAQQEAADEPAPPTTSRRAPLGRLLVQRGFISEVALEQALDRQREERRPLGQVLLAMGAVTPQNLARALTEQHGFDFSGSLRQRLGAGDAEEDFVDDHVPAETYLVREGGDDEPLHVASSFLDAADAAFELIDERDPERLEIVRARAGELEHVWAYRRGNCVSPTDPLP